jgi:hypothetical protein
MLLLQYFEGTNDSHRGHHRAHAYRSGSLAVKSNIWLVLAYFIGTELMIITLDDHIWWISEK